MLAVTGRMKCSQEDLRLLTNRVVDQTLPLFGLETQLAAKKKAVQEATAEAEDAQMLLEVLATQTK